MKCYNHSDVDSIGICKICNKGLCKECVVDTGNGIACHGKCEEEVKVLNNLIERNKAIYKRSNSSYKITFLINMAIAIVFLSTGIFVDIFVVRIMTLSLGVIFLVIAVNHILTAKKIIDKNR